MRNVIPLVEWELKWIHNHISQFEDPASVCIRITTRYQISEKTRLQDAQWAGDITYLEYSEAYGTLVEDICNLNDKYVFPLLD